MLHRGNFRDQGRSSLVRDPLLKVKEPLKELISPLKLVNVREQQLLVRMNLPDLLLQSLLSANLEEGPTIGEGEGI